MFPESIWTTLFHFSDYDITLSLMVLLLPAIIGLVIILANIAYTIINENSPLLLTPILLVLPLTPIGCCYGLYANGDHSVSCINTKYCVYCKSNKICGPKIINHRYKDITLQDVLKLQNKSFDSSKLYKVKLCGDDKIVSVYDKIGIQCKDCNDIWFNIDNDNNILKYINSECIVEGTLDNKDDLGILINGKD